MLGRRGISINCFHWDYFVSLIEGYLSEPVYKPQSHNLQIPKNNEVSIQLSCGRETLSSSLAPRLIGNMNSRSSLAPPNHQIVKPSTKYIVEPPHSQTIYLWHPPNHQKHSKTSVISKKKLGTFTAQDSPTYRTRPGRRCLNLGLDREFLCKAWSKLHIYIYIFV
jgi:hypothetical protein